MKRKKEPAKRIYLDDYILQKDMRVRMPKEIIKNMNVKPGESYFEVYFEPDKQEIVLTVISADFFIGNATPWNSVSDVICSFTIGDYFTCGIL